MLAAGWKQYVRAALTQFRWGLYKREIVALQEDTC